MNGAPGAGVFLHSSIFPVMRIEEGPFGTFRYAHVDPLLNVANYPGANYTFEGVLPSNDVNGAWKNIPYRPTAQIYFQTDRKSNV